MVLLTLVEPLCTDIHNFQAVGPYTSSPEVSFVIVNIWNMRDSYTVFEDGCGRYYPFDFRESFEKTYPNFYQPSVLNMISSFLSFRVIILSNDQVKSNNHLLSSPLRECPHDIWVLS